ncbi:MAG: hypothetical protein JXX29_19150 [Deltaproteobacteria bacterium]|nr:hypothetical protein [Deltaproteobacteria bacterium]MBN2673805.1 hypothetical protein [Deltaproteobacteria bacterium]
MTPRQSLSQLTHRSGPAIGRRFPSIDQNRYSETVAVCRLKHQAAGQAGMAKQTRDLLRIFGGLLLLFIFALFLQRFLGLFLFGFLRIFAFGHTCLSLVIVSQQ